MTVLVLTPPGGRSHIILIPASRGEGNRDAGRVCQGLVGHRSHKPSTSVHLYSFQSFGAMPLVPDRHLNFGGLVDKMQR